MKGKIFAASLALACASGLASFATPVLAADIDVSISIGQPGYYGQIDIGDYPRPRLLYRQPVIIERGYGNSAPIYLHVPPGHAKKWSKHCGAYNACGERVYFVNNSWYEREYVPRYHARNNDYRGERRENRRDDRHDRRDDRNDHRGDDRGNDRGNGKGHNR